MHIEERTPEVFHPQNNNIGTSPVVKEASPSPIGQYALDMPFRQSRDNSSRVNEEFEYPSADETDSSEDTSSLSPSLVSLSDGEDVDGEGLTSSRGASPSATPVDDYTPLMVRSEPDHTNGSPLLRELLRTLIHVTLHTPQFLNASPTLRDVVTGLNPHEVSSDELVDQISKIVIQEVHGFVSFPIEVDTDEDEVNHDSTYTNQIMEEIPIQDAHATVSNPSPPTGIPAFDDLSDSHDVMYGTSAGWAGEEISDGKLESVHLDTTQSWRDSIMGVTDDGDQSCTDTDHESDNHSDAGTSGYAKIRAGWDKSDAAEDSASYQPLKRRQWAKLLFILVLVILGCFAFFVYDYGVRPGVFSSKCDPVRNDRV